MEFLGDAVLRLAATEFIDQNFPESPVGFCSNLRAQLVSDRWLSDVGAKLEIEQYLMLGRYAQGIIPPNRDCGPMPPKHSSALYTAPLATLKPFTVGSVPTGTPQPRIYWLHPTNSTAKHHFRSGAKAKARTAPLRHRRMQPQPRRPRTLPLPGEHPRQRACRGQRPIPEGSRQNAATAALQALEGSDAPQASQ